MPLMVPVGYQDVIMTTAEVSIPFWDRLLILFGYKVRVSVNHYCKEKPIEVRTQITLTAGKFDRRTAREVETHYGNEVTSRMVDAFDCN